MSSDVGSRIARNSIFSLARTLLAVPLTLLLTPYIIWHLGKEEFGVWALVGVISSYAQLSDFGITESLIKFVAEYKSHEDVERINRLVNTALVAYLVISLVFGFAAFQAMPFVVEHILRIPPVLVDKAIFVFSLGILLFLLNMTMGVFGSLVIGFQRMGYSNGIGIVGLLLTTIGTVAFLSTGWGLVGLIYTNAIVTVVTAVANIMAAKRLCRGLRINPFCLCSTSMFKTIFSFSWKVQVSSLSQLMVYQLDRVLLSHFVGLAAVGYYEIASRLATQARGFVAAIFSPLVPAASELHARDEEERLVGLYRRSVKYLALIAIPLLMLVAAISPAFIKVWLGKGYGMTAITLSCLTLSYLFVLFTVPGSMILSGMGRPEVSMVTAILAGLTNLGLGLFLVQTVGYYGVIAGITFSLVSSGIVFIYLVHRSLPALRFSLYVQTVGKPLLICAGLSVITVTLALGGYLSGFTTLALAVVVFLGSFAVATIRSGCLDTYDREVLARFGVRW